MTFSITSIIGQTCLPLLKFEKKKKSDSLETSSIYFLKNTQCRTLNNRFLTTVYQYLMSKRSERTIYIWSHSKCNNFKSINIQMPNIFIQDLMMAFTALKVASRPTNINGTLFGIRGL